MVGGRGGHIPTCGTGSRGDTCAALGGVRGAWTTTGFWGLRSLPRQGQWDSDPKNPRMTISGEITIKPNCHFITLSHPG